MILVGLWLIYLLSILLTPHSPIPLRISPKIHIIINQKRNSCSGLVAKTTTSDEEDGDVDGGGTAEGNVRRGSKGGSGGAYVFREAAEA